jgi:hypothetical protein
MGALLVRHRLAGAMILVLTASLSAAPALDAQDHEGFVSLFNGENLDGWAVVNSDGANFSVVDGLLRVEGPEGWLRSERQYTDFTIHADVRFLTDDSDSGIFVRTDGESVFVRGWPANSYQIQLRDVSRNQTTNPILIGNIYRHRTPPGETEFDAAAAIAAAKPTGEWQRVEIDVIGDSIVVNLNGVTVTRASGLVNPSGYIGIQGETGIVEFREILIREH